MLVTAKSRRRSRIPAAGCMGWFTPIPLRPLAPSTEVPLEVSGGQLPPCSQAAREQSVRVVAPLGPGAMTVKIAGVEGSSLSLRSERTVLFGSARSPCVSALEASETKAAGGISHHQVLIFPRHSGKIEGWLFRVSLGEAGAEVASLRPLVCASPQP